MNVMKTAAALIMLSAGGAQAADLSQCASAKLESPADCKNVQAVFDFSKCENGPAAITVAATCWNGKRVAKVKVSGHELTATFQEQAQWGKAAWNVSGMKSTRLKNSASVQAIKAPAQTESDRTPAGVTVPPAPIPPAPTIADDSLKIGGSLDLYYAFNANNPRPVTAPTGTSLAQPGGNNGYRTFDLYHDDFNLALAEANFTKTKDGVTGFLALDAGHTADVLSPNDESGKHVTQATVNFKPEQVSGLSVTAGKMMTHMGLEVTKSKDNWNYSRSLLFGWAIPFWHTGLAASYPVLKDKVTVTGYLYNKTNGAYQNNRSKTFGAQVSSAPVENMVLVYNFLSGNETDSTAQDHVRTLHELNGTYAITPEISAAFDVVKGSLTNSGASVGTADWLAWSVAARWAPGKLWLSPRFEVYEDPDGVSFGTATGQRLTTKTFTVGYDLGGGLETRVEFREDESTQAVFSKGNNSETSEKQVTGTLGILYNF